MTKAGKVAELFTMFDNFLSKQGLYLEEINALINNMKTSLEKTVKRR